MYNDYLSEFLGDEEFGRLVSELERMRVQFMAKAHHKDCRSPLDCPLDHSRCRRRLGLHTAIVWSIAMYISNMLTTKRVMRLANIDRLRSLMLFAGSVFYLHRNRKKYLDFLLFVNSWEKEISSKYYELHEKFIYKRLEERRREK